MVVANAASNKADVAMPGMNMGEEDGPKTHPSVGTTKDTEGSSEPPSPRERKLYEPVRRALHKRFSEFGECFIEVTAEGLSEEAKKLLPEKSMFMMLQERKRPDLIGQVSGFTGLSKKRLVVEVKPGVLTLDDVYQLKLYADMLSSDFALLISPKGLNYERVVFLRDNPHILSYSAGLRTITILTFDATTETLGFVQGLTQEDPFVWRL